MSKVTKEQVMEMRALALDGWFMPEIAERFGVTKQLVYDALRGFTWKHLPGVLPETPRDTRNQIKGEGVNTAKLKPEQVVSIRKEYAACPLVASGKRSRISYALAKKYGVYRGLICQIVSRKIWKHIP